MALLAPTIISIPFLVKLLCRFPPSAIMLTVLTRAMLCGILTTKLLTGAPGVSGTNAEPTVCLLLSNKWLLRCILRAACRSVSAVILFLAVITLLLLTLLVPTLRNLPARGLAQIPFRWKTLQIGRPGLKRLCVKTWLLALSSICLVLLVMTQGVALKLLIPLMTWPSSRKSPTDRSGTSGTVLVIGSSCICGESPTALCDAL